jgi:lysyl-tRNA synthetase class 1
MFWGDKIVDEILEQYKKKVSEGIPLVIRDEKTASGRVHVGSMRGIAIHGVVHEILQERGISVKYLYEINDFDPMDGLPVYLDETVYAQYMGKPLCDIPSPDGIAKNYAEYFGNEFKRVILESGFEPEFYLSSELYRSGRYNEVIRLALENAPQIREIYKKVSGGVKPEDWMPLQVVCESCGKIGTTKVRSFDGEEVSYTCEPALVTWAVGCGHAGKISPFDGNAKLPWKVEWAAKFKVLDVDIEGAGKDHSTRGGARDIANHISREVFGYQPPFDIPYEFFLVGGKKMSSSKGAGSTAREVSSLLPTKLFRFLFVMKDPKKVIDFIPDGDTIPILYDFYDKYAESFFGDQDDDYSRVFALAHPKNIRTTLKASFRPRFSLVSFLVQMPHMKYEQEIEKLKETSLTKEDEQEAAERAVYAKNWLTVCAPENYRYKLQIDELPAQVSDFSEVQKQALHELLVYIESQKSLDGQALHTALHDIKEHSGVTPKEFFSALYILFLGKESGPKAGFLLSVLDKSFLESRLKQVQ